VSAVTQPRMHDREVVRCECGLIQFKAKSGLCLKSVCRKPYLDLVDDPPIEPAPEVPVVRL
jgi:nitrite reductase/ring-hydroxylating ferredoxin subunit